VKTLLGAAGQDFAALKAAAARRDFKPVALNAKATFAAENTTRNPPAHIKTSSSMTYDQLYQEPT